MTKELQPAELEQSIKEIVEGRNGIKMVELVGRLYYGLLSEGYELSDDYVLDFIWGMVDNGKLVEVEYTLPHMNGRVKSFLLPAKTDVRIKNGDKKVDPNESTKDPNQQSA